MTTHIMPLDFHVGPDNAPVILSDTLEHLDGEAQPADEWAEWLRSHRTLTEAVVAQRTAEHDRDDWTPDELHPERGTR